MLVCSSSILFFFFFNDTATTEIYTLSLHDALPISDWILSRPVGFRQCLIQDHDGRRARIIAHRKEAPIKETGTNRSEEHTSELQSQSNLVCRLLLEKKKKKNIRPEYHTITTYHI